MRGPVKKSVVPRVACWLSGALVILSTISAVNARQVPTLPSGREIVARHVAAIGGVAGHRAIQSVWFRGRFELPQQKIVGDFEMVAARPARARMRIGIPGIGQVEDGYDGRVGWSVDPLAGPQVQSGRQLVESADDAWFDRDLFEPDYVLTLTTVTQAEFDGKRAFRVQVILRSGSESLQYFDVESGLYIGSEATRATSQGTIPVVQVARDYRQFGGLRIPVTRIHRAMGVEQVATITSVEFDVVPDQAFALPPGVRALIKP